MNIKFIFKTIIDFLMALIFLLLMFPHATSIRIHEILGVIIIPLVSIHLILNRKWIKSAVKNIIHGKANDKSRYMFFLSLGLFLSLVITMVSGFLISQFLIPSEVVPAPMQILHRLAAMVCAILIVLHIRLHLKYLKSIFTKRRNKQ
jgi:hypothetical protein